MDTTTQELKWDGDVERQIARCIEALQTKGHISVMNFIVKADGPNYKVTVARMVRVEMDLEDLDGHDDKA